MCLFGMLPRDQPRRAGRPAAIAALRARREMKGDRPPSARHHEAIEKSAVLAPAEDAIVMNSSAKRTAPARHHPALGSLQLLARGKRNKARLGHFAKRIEALGHFRPTLCRSDPLPEQRQSQSAKLCGSIERETHPPETNQPGAQRARSAYCPGAKYAEFLARRRRHRRLPRPMTRRWLLPSSRRHEAAAVHLGSKQQPCTRKGD